MLQIKLDAQSFLLFSWLTVMHLDVLLAWFKSRWKVWWKRCAEVKSQKSEVGAHRRKSNSLVSSSLCLWYNRFTYDQLIIKKKSNSSLKSRRIVQLLCRYNWNNSSHTHKLKTHLCECATASERREDSDATYGDVPSFSHQFCTFLEHICKKRMDYSLYDLYNYISLQF